VRPCKDAPVDRRSFLGLVIATAGAAGLTGCTDSSPGPMPSGATTSVAPTDDDQIRAATFASEVGLIGLYAAAMKDAQPARAEQLRAIQAQHIEHAHRLRPGQEVPTDAPSPATPAATPGDRVAASPNPSGSGSAAAPTGSAGATASASQPSTREVLAVERTALAQRRASCEQAEDADLARTLALIAASEAQHADVLHRWLEDEQ
jgi:hypothetical protein